MRQTRRRASPQWLLRAVLCSALAVVGASVASGEPVDLAPGDEWQIGALTNDDRLFMERQRNSVLELTRRHFGRTLPDSEADLYLLQVLLDEHRVAPADKYLLQAMGVVLGDVMAEHLKLEWVSAKDPRGRSRALRVGDTDTLIFPVTMISKRMEFGEPVDIAALYEKIGRLVDEERSR